MEFRKLNFKDTEEAILYTENNLVPGKHYQCVYVDAYVESRGTCAPEWEVYCTDDYRLVRMDDHSVQLDPLRALVVTEEVK